MVKIGFLPLYIKLYDDIEKEPSKSRARMEKFYDTCARKLTDLGATVVTTPFCRIAKEFEDAMQLFLNEKVDAIVTLHLAYSPSLESIDAIEKSGLPLIVLDTTEAFDFGTDANFDDIMMNHGIHGVMDMCNLLLRRGVSYAIAAGHYEEPGLFEKVIEYAKAVVAANAFKGTRVGRIGESFKGMGDFKVEDSVLKKDFGIEVVQFDSDADGSFFDVSDEDIESEIEADRKKYDVDNVMPDIYRDSVITGLGFRRWIEANRLDAFTFNFLSFTEDSVPNIVPFMEASKALARGLGYAGEGDTLTASLVGAMQKGFSNSSFVEIFCPDWKGGRLFLSHMGEMNIALAEPDSVGCAEREYIFSSAQNPVVLSGRYKAGRAVYLNIMPLDEGYGLVLANVTMESVDDSLFGTVRGWMKPDMPVAEFLKAHSIAGATHHSALTYDVDIEALAFFGKLLGLKVTVL